MIKPPFSNEGTTATHSAEASTSSGMPVSGADSISSRTVPAASTRSSALLVSFMSFLSSSPKANADTARTSRTTRVFFIAIQFSRSWVFHASLTGRNGLRGDQPALREWLEQGRTGSGKAKKIGADSGDPNLHSQPRLPGSVVGGPSMRYLHRTDKITGGTVPW